jgi:hypothetical protein
MEVWELEEQCVWIDDSEDHALGVGGKAASSASHTPATPQEEDDDVLEKDYECPSTSEREWIDDENFTERLCPSTSERESPNMINLTLDNQHRSVDCSIFSKQVRRKIKQNGCLNVRQLQEMLSSRKCHTKGTVQQLEQNLLKIC